jgi:phenylacetate-CoA ligase
MFNYFGVASHLIRLLAHLHWSPKRLYQYQDAMVRETVCYAYRHVRFYHDKLDALGLNPQNFSSVGDLNKLPVISRREIQQNSANMFSDEFDKQRLLTVSTSGSTGQPLWTYLTRDEDALRKAKLLRANIVCGQKMRDRWVVVTAPVHHANPTRLQRLLRLFSPVPISVFDDTVTQLEQLRQLRPDILDGYSSSLLMLAKEIEKGGKDWAVHPRVVIGGAELIDEVSRRIVEAAFDAPFFDEYACNEMERLAWQCEEKAGYHVDADTVVMQFVDENGEEVDVGERGEIVCTSLFNRAMPFIRYSVGDVGVQSEGNLCPCGRTFPLMKVVEGRKDSFIVLPDGRTLSPLAIGWAMEGFKYYSSVRSYRVIQKTKSYLKLLIEKDTLPEESVMSEELVLHLGKTLRLKDSEVSIDVEFLSKIPLDKSGKHRKVISEI